MSVTASGVPWRSTIRWCLEPGRARSTGEGPTWSPLGKRAWRESGLGAPTDIHALQERITQLEQHNADLTAELSEREEDLVAARAANRQLMATLNARS
ncbi:hypothetical protein [Streptomyces sp. NPDC006971]|uniref:hypothetical protein n=1 Tax=Streptomyces sp. NPDC006971 TaxID=3154784 RepID=UPI0033FEC384